VLPEEDVVQLLSRERQCGQSHSFLYTSPKIVIVAANLGIFLAQYGSYLFPGTLASVMT
jgi:hypothetical protein